MHHGPWRSLQDYGLQFRRWFGQPIPNQHLALCSTWALGIASPSSAGILVTIAHRCVFTACFDKGLTKVVRQSPKKHDTTRRAPHHFCYQESCEPCKRVTRNTCVPWEVFNSTSRYLKVKFLVSSFTGLSISGRLRHTQGGHGAPAMTQLRVIGAPHYWSFMIRRSCE